ncbi:hypothetical protein SAY86_011142 [Trapa natans]|uniref:Bet v I/Major latex protein domain-containing protein n=1 Tax=Trapa natans TaxID=22666 RepID=A0AAN7R0K7_TRANT|nr:hypothetical protein SAY86_011142 [Trapa natans]
MGVTSYVHESKTVVAPEKMFKALIIDSHNLIPKIAPEGIKNIVFIEGDGSVGSIKQTNFADGGHLKWMKHRIDAIDSEKLYCKYTLIESEPSFQKVECVVYEVKFEASGDGGCVCKMSSEYHSKEGVELEEEEIKKGKDKALGLFKVVEEHLIANPNY